MADRPVGRRRFYDEVDPAPETDRGDDGAAHAPVELADPDAAAGRGPAEDANEHTALPPRVESWRRRSATGAMLTGFAFGLQQVFEPERKEPAIMMETSGVPPRDLPVEADLEAATSRRSVVKIRPWLLDEDLEEGGSGAGRTGATGIAPRARRPRRLRRRRR